MLRYNKNYATLAFNYVLKNLKKIILAFRIRKYVKIIIWNKGIYK